jgi:hypothetical protein
VATRRLDFDWRLSAFPSDHMLVREEVWKVIDPGIRAHVVHACNPTRSVHGLREHVKA